MKFIVELFDVDDSGEKIAEFYHDNPFCAIGRGDLFDPAHLPGAARERYAGKMLEVVSVEHHLFPKNKGGDGITQHKVTLCLKAVPQESCKRAVRG